MHSNDVFIGRKFRTSLSHDFSLTNLCSRIKDNEIDCLSPYGPYSQGKVS